MLQLLLEGPNCLRNLLHLYGMKKSQAEFLLNSFRSGSSTILKNDYNFMDWS